jgi:hypothetical protein
VVKFRFDAATIAALLRAEWWSWPDQELLDIMPWPGTVPQLLVYAGLRGDGRERTVERTFRMAVSHADGNFLEIL